MRKRFVKIVLTLGLQTALLCQWVPPYGTPAYHHSPPKPGEKLRPILTPDQVKRQGMLHADYQGTVYRIAARDQAVFYQLPCYCYCDRRTGHHKSLRSCFEVAHATECGECMKEAVYVHRQLQAGKSIQQIREGLARGEFIHIDLKGATL
jgi:hypothetical protein